MPVRVVLLAAALGLGGCHLATSPTDLSISDFAANVITIDGIGAVLTPGSPPASALGPSVSATSSTSGNVTGKGADIVTLRASSAFQTVYVSIGGVDGYLQLALAAPVTELTVALDTASNLPRSSFTTSYRVASSTGLIGAATTISNVVSPPANDSYSMTKGTTFTVSAPGVLGNDLLGSSSGARVDFLEFSGARPLPANVTSFQNSGNGNGGFVLTPIATFSGTISLHYVIYYFYGGAQFSSTIATAAVAVN
jgi:hypothetical protein